jgi:hypothetical protein
MTIRDTTDLARQVLADFRGGMVDVPDETNARGFTTHYRPVEAMTKALAALSPKHGDTELWEALERERQANEELADSELALQIRVELLNEALEYTLRLIDVHDGNAKAHYGRPLFDTVEGIQVPYRDGSRIKSLYDARQALAQPIEPSAADEEFVKAVWDALSGDHNDLRRQAIILRAHRAALSATPPQAPTEPVADSGLVDTHLAARQAMGLFYELSGSPDMAKAIRSDAWEIGTSDAERALLKAFEATIETARKEALTSIKQTAASGGEMEICPDCSGAGGDNNTFTCALCDGSGGVPLATLSQQTAASGDGGWPELLTPELREILGWMCFQLGQMAHAYQAVGEFVGTEGKLNKRAEDEQAFMLHKWLGYWSKHGEEWNKHAAADLKRVRAAIESLTPTKEQGE